MITLNDYWMGRDKKYPLALTTDIIKNALITVEVVNLLIKHLQEQKIPLELSSTGTLVSSGWRPPEVNQNTPGAAIKSKHLFAQACDLYDPEGVIDEFLLTHPEVLEKLGLWMEHPSATKGWCHVQTVPPGSGRRVFFP